MSRRVDLVCLVSIGALVLPCVAQDLEELRGRLRDDLRSVHFAKSFTGHVIAADELNLNGGELRFDDDTDTRLTTFTLPFQRRFACFGDAAPELHVEGAIGYARARQRVADLYGGAAPGLETAIETRWSTYSGLAGVGLRFALGDEWAFTPIVGGGLAYIENDTDYAGPGAAATRELADGIAFNWDGLAWTAGGAGRIDWRRGLGDGYRLEALARYDMRWVGTFETDDPAQEFSSRAQLLTLRGDVVGPTGWRAFDAPVNWRGTLGYRRFLEGDLYESEDLFQIGGALELELAAKELVASALSLQAHAFFGDDVTGWTVGFGVTF